MNWYKLLISQQKIKSVPQDLKNDPSFKAWFGNSKVIDSQGNPLVVYKGMYPFDYTKEDKKNNIQGPEIDIIKRPQPFPAFDSNDENPPVNIAGFFTDSPSVAENFSFSEYKTIYPVYLSIQNPKIFDAKGGSAGYTQFGPSGKPFRDAIRSGKYDGVFILNTKDEGNIYIALSPNQIKSALSNNTFNKNDPRIHASKIAMPIMDEKEYNNTNYLDIGHNRYWGKYDKIEKQKIEEFLYMFLKNNKIIIKKSTNFEDTHDDIFSDVYDYIAYGRVEVISNNEQNKKEIKASVIFSLNVKNKIKDIEKKRILKTIENMLSTYFKYPVNVYFYNQ